MARSDLGLDATRLGEVAADEEQAHQTPAARFHIDECMIATG
jgi:hypothetical protein